MAKRKERPIQIIPFKELDNHYWVNGLSFRVINGEVEQLNGLPDERLIKALEEYISIENK